MSDPNIEILKKETYRKAIENSVGSRLFNSLIVHFSGSEKPVDILNDGELSCAYFVSSVLTLFGAFKQPHATVATLQKLVSGDERWKQVSLETAEPGDIVFYKKTMYEDGSSNAHVGFVTKENMAVSTNYKQKMVTRHALDARPVESVWRYSWNDL